MSNNHNQENKVVNDEIDLIEFLMVLWKRKIFIILFTLIFTFIIALFLYFFIPKSYECKTSFNNIEMSTGEYISLKNFFFSYKTKMQIVSNLPSRLKKEVEQKMNFLENTFEIKSYPDLKDIKKSKDETQSDITNLYVIVKSEKFDDLELLNNITKNIILKNIILNSAKLFISNRISELQKLVYVLSEKEYMVSKVIPIEELKLKELKKLQNSNSPIINESNYATLQFNLEDKLQYLPIQNQITMLESSILDSKSDISLFKLRINWYNETIDELYKLSEIIKNERVPSTEGLLQIFRDMINHCKSAYAKSTLSDFYSLLFTDNLRYTNNSITSLTLISRKIALKAAIVFVVLLVISVAYVLLSEAVKRYTNN